VKVTIKLVLVGLLWLLPVRPGNDAPSVDGGAPYVLLQCCLDWLAEKLGGMPGQL